MKVLHLSISAGGGAGTAARRSVEALRQQGVHAELWTNDGSGAAQALRSRRWALCRAILAMAPLRRYPRRRLYSVWSNAWLPSRLAPRVVAARPDIVHLHWVGDGFLSLGELAHFRVPVAWTLHDTWAFTGGCHYPADCGQFRSECGCCPQLASMKSNDLSARNLRVKRRIAGSVARWIAPSEWISSLAAKSTSVVPGRVRVIPNGCNEQIYTPADRVAARRLLGVPQEVVVLVAGATDLQETRKGAALLPDAVGRIRDAIGRECVLLVFGNNAPPSSAATGGTMRSLGALRSEAEVAAVLAAGDVLLLPSLQDNLPNIAVEALGCGCPVVGFDTGGLREIVTPGKTGALTADATAFGLADAVVDWFHSVPIRAAVAARCREEFQLRFTYPLHARRLTDLYREMLAERPSRSGKTSIEPSG